MRVLISSCLILYLFTVCSYSFFPFGSPKLDLSKKITELENSNLETKNGVNDNKLLLKELIKVNANLRADIKANANINAKAFAGIDKSISTSMKAGRDVNITNDPQMLKYMIGGLLGIILFLLRDNFAQRKWLQNMILSKQKYQKKYEEVINGGVKG